MENTKTTFRPILFSTPMVQAILENRKTSTRRVVKPTPIENENYHFEKLEKLGSNMYGMIPNQGIEIDNRTIFPFNGVWKCPYQVGDVFWVRETFAPISNHKVLKFIYKAGISDWTDDLVKWKPSIFMPKEACRIFLRLKSIRVERLRDIFHSDARAEGVDFVEGINGNIYYNYLTGEFGCNELYSFMTLWQSINGLESWAFNPFVFVYEFEQIEKPLDFIL